MIVKTDGSFAALVFITADRQEEGCPPCNHCKLATAVEGEGGL